MATSSKNILLSLPTCHDCHKGGSSYGWSHMVEGYWPGNTQRDINMGVAFCSLPLFPQTEHKKPKTFHSEEKNVSRASVKWNNYETRRVPTTPEEQHHRGRIFYAEIQAQMFPVKRNRNERHKETSKKLNMQPIFLNAWKALRTNWIQTDRLSVRHISSDELWVESRWCITACSNASWFRSILCFSITNHNALQVVSQLLSFYKRYK